MTPTTRDECIDRAAQALVDDLARQVKRSPRDAAVAAGCRTQEAIDAWVARWRPDEPLRSSA